MGRLAELVLRRKHALLLLCASLVVASAFGLRRLRRAHDLLSFLPQADPMVTLFRDVAARFGGLEVALVGVETDDIFRYDVLARLAATTDDLRGVRGVDSVVSLTDLPTTKSDEAGLSIASLVPRPIPHGAAQLAAIRRQALGDDNAVGSVVSADGHAAVIVAFLAASANPVQVAGAIREVARRGLDGSGARVTFGGAPFFGETVATQTQRDLRFLTPLALLAIVAVLFLHLREAWGLALVLVTVLAGALVALGAQGFVGHPVTLVTGSMPVLLLACGIGSALHILAAYDRARPQLDAADAVRAALRQVGRPVLYAGLASAAAFASFVAMNVEPMRSFGLFCAIGILASLVFSLVALPAVLALTQRKARPVTRASWAGPTVLAITHFATRQRWPIRVGVIIAVVTGGVLALRVPTQIGAANFFSPGSTPYESEKMLERRFGGSQFAQIYVRADLTDPENLRKLMRLGESVRVVGGVSQLRSIVEPLLQVSDAMGEGRRLPETRAQAQNLFFLLESEPSLRQLVSAQRNEALLQVRVAGLDATQIGRTTDALERLARASGLSAVVTGTPAIHQTLAKSVVRNQLLSSALALVFAIVLIGALFRSVKVGLFATVPAVTTLLVVYGGMGWLRIPLDVGTSMIGSLGLGMGVHQAIHFLWHAQAGQDDGEGAQPVMTLAASNAGPPIVVGSLVIAVGFGVLAFGRMLPMRYFGALTAETALVGALATVLLIPAIVERLPARALARSPGHAVPLPAEEN